MAITKVTSGLISADASSIDLNIDAGTLYLDVSENRVGIGTTSPDRKLHINESASGTSNFIHLTTADTGTSGSNGFLVGIGSAGNAELWNYEAQPILFATSSTERMRIDSSGNVGIGTDSPASLISGGSSPILSIGGTDGGLTTGEKAGTISFITSDTSYTGTYSDGITGEIASVATSSTGAAYGLAFYTGTITGSDRGERLRISHDGNVGIGTTSPATRLDITADNTLINSKGTVFIGSESTWGVDKGGQLSLGGRYTDSVTEITYGNISGRKENGTGSSGNGYLAFGTSANNGVLTEKMRIDSSGNLLVGTTSAFGVGATFSPQGSNGILAVFNQNYGNGFISHQFKYNGTVVGSIVINTSSTAYNTSSDYRLKENVDYEFNALDRVAQLKPARFNFIADADTTVDGFLAHEVQDIVPEAITGEKDAVREEEYEITPAVLDDDGNVVTEAVMGTREVPEYQGIDQSKLVPLLTKAIQELSDKVDNQQTIIDNLTTRIETLENA